MRYVEELTERTGQFSTTIVRHVLRWLQHQHLENSENTFVA